MKNTNIFALAAGMGSMILASTATADVSVSVDLVHLGSNGSATAPADVATYRVYANMDSGWRVDAVYGNSSGVMSIGANGSFYQNAFGGNTSMDINPALGAVFPSLAYDSWVTIGLADQTGGNALNNIGIDFSGFAAGGDITTDNGSWFVTPDDAQGQEVDGQVLIGQFSVLNGSGDLAADMSSLTVSLQGKDANGDTWQATSLNGLPAPGALALLGVAGIASRRRRK